MNEEEQNSEQMAQQLQDCMQEIQRVHIVNEFTKVGKLDNFEGDESKWSEWDFKLLGYIGGFSPALEQAMRNAKQSIHVIPIPTVETEEHLSQRLFAMLSSQPFVASIVAALAMQNTVESCLPLGL